MGSSKACKMGIPEWFLGLFRSQGETLVVVQTEDEERKRNWCCSIRTVL